MKKKKKFNLLTRLFTGLIYISLVIFSIEKGEKTFRIMMMILSFLCLFEFLIISGTDTILTKIVSLFFLSSIIMDFFLEKGHILYIICFIPYSVTFFIIQLFLKKKSYKERIVQIGNLIFGFVYIIIPFYLASYIYTYGKKLILGIFILIWINDSLSYLVGKRWGRIKIATSISPKKSVEGFIGGFLFCSATGFFLYKIWDKEYWIILSFIVSIFSTIGDLIESLIKRSYNVKNSSIFFPGHGGFLDRLDSFIIVIPVITTIIISVVYFF
ncbi:phosphatidate cytidylyltransferase [Blattabacterium cuenoti]|uniref:phosphatidate cytidylyltransferase n=1 Tax=Blattabacterium cuenoti TaxID=1653831 RepID=UPI00163CAB5A|nr:phosphatidate cytidylyltransferase [Blattabacterium cuenoti]